MQAMPMQPGQGPPVRPSPEQIQAIQRQIAIDAQKAGMSVPDFVNHLRQQAAMQMRMQQEAAMRAQQQGGAGGQQGPPGQEGSGGQQSNGEQNQNHSQPPPPTPEQIQQFQQQQQRMAQQQQAQQQQQQPITPGPPNPTAIAMANFLRSQDLKLRTVIFNGERKDMFRVKRALRAIQSPAYEKARKKHPDLPEVTDRASLENAFKLLPLSMLALRVRKVEDEHEGHNHGPQGAAAEAEKKKKKRNRIKGQWNVAIERQQDAGDDMYYIWLYEGSQTMRKVYAGLVVLGIFIGVLYPLWPLKMRLGVYYLSYGFLGLLCLFFAMAIFRLILFVITYYALSPGLWLYPNLWEDVSFMDSFRPVWAWHDLNPKKKRKSKKAVAGNAAAQSQFANSTGQPTPASATTSAVNAKMQVPVPTQRAKTPQIEEVEDDE
ncbi:translocation protein sec62 [Ophiostoma piceae UAMH 11346]|uniref:Translocation protein SEC62 n=1 Tax=Ophiostoma piceae (strain UAMH 11346) TaxID=1262450 RepID=S3BSB2_OPHP1|nr:translocation protein sec62 [Ophiostoma piceae UAMH 11346]